MDAPWVTVITATIGRRAAMLRKLDALRAQTLPPERFEWVVVADGDDDGTLAAIAAAAVPFELRILRLPRRAGAATARNAAVAAARGAILLFSDDDCVPDDDNLERHWRAHAAAGPKAMVGSLTFVAEDGRTTASRPRRVGYWNLNGANSSVPAADFAAAGGFDESLAGYGGEDVLLGYRLAANGVRFCSLPEAHAVHLGADPAVGGDLAKARAAGRNAARIGRTLPELRRRLGVQPAWLRVKRLLLPPWGARLAGERAYVDGALEGWAEGEESGAT